PIEFLPPWATLPPMMRCPRRAAGHSRHWPASDISDKEVSRNDKPPENGQFAYEQFLLFLNLARDELQLRAGWRRENGASAG
ncbi:hypothetical protein AAFF_G00202060, partial [Aldrovandia affinis]